MSKTNCLWLTFAKNMIRKYPDGLNENERRAVELAIKETEEKKNGDVRMGIIRRSLMNGTHSVEGAAIACHVSESSARNYRTEFIRLVGKNFKCESLLPPS